MILYNPTDKKVEFIYDSKHYILNSKESRNFPDNIAEHAIKRFKAPLVEYSPMYDKEITKVDISYEELSWGRLRSLGVVRKIYKPGMNRENLTLKLREYDSQIGTLQKSSS